MRALIALVLLIVVSVNGFVILKDDGDTNMNQYKHGGVDHDNFVLLAEDNGLTQGWEEETIFKASEDGITTDSATSSYKEIPTDDPVMNKSSEITYSVETDRETADIRTTETVSTDDREDICAVFNCDNTIQTDGETPEQSSTDGKDSTFAIISSTAEATVTMTTKGFTGTESPTTKSSTTMNTTDSTTVSSTTTQSMTMTNSPTTTSTTATEPKTEQATTAHTIDMTTLVSTSTPYGSSTPITSTTDTTPTNPKTEQTGQKTDLTIIMSMSTIDPDASSSTADSTYDSTELPTETSTQSSANKSQDCHRLVAILTLVVGVWLRLQTEL